ncbi:selenoneine biosynthesis selenosugar synthase SenB [Noviherbaspirillum saxi]|uniref:selenoneine biosynthesis selenosugar synthase SenB n=1 Tax=Noviherbaspirillum saxi TaxID=2320863 RepID=UPI001F1BC3DE|nr:selenoneine biosynthesis selenosugar synthase SenB [Noviherbaspirillum saxi]
MNKQHVIIISPATANANNGNWQTASRWAGFLSSSYDVSVMEEWDDSHCDLMIALHARRSATSLARFAQAFGHRPILLVLTGTDLYRDIHSDAQAQASLQLATRLVLLQDAGLQQLPPALRAKACVIYQSAPQPPDTPRVRADARFEVIMIGHLRTEKDPLTFMRAAAVVAPSRIRMTHIGGALDAALGRQAESTQRALPQYRWLGDLPHAQTLEYLAASDMMVIASRMEGGANVIIESVVHKVPVLASDIPGNRGMLGDEYAGYFPPGDSTALAALIDRACKDPVFRTILSSQCKERSGLFEPARERAALTSAVRELLAVT